MSQNIPSSIMLDQLYPTYDGGYMRPPLTTACDIGDKIPDHMTQFKFTPILTYVGDDIVFTPCDGVTVKSEDVIGCPITKPKKDVWSVTYRQGHGCNYTAHVVAESMAEAVKMCVESGVLEASIMSMHRLESTRVLY